MAAKKKAAGSKKKTAKSKTITHKGAVKVKGIKIDGRSGPRTAAQKAATARLVAANKKRRGGKKAKPRVSKPTKFQRFLLTKPEEAKRKMGWK